MAPTHSYVLPHTFNHHLGTAFSKAFKCFHLNIRSFTRKEHDLQLFFEQTKQSFDVIMLTETWCVDDVNIFRLPLYNTFYLNRSTGRGGGICTLVKKPSACEILNQFSVITYDYEFLSVIQNNTVFAVCYRPPNGSVTSFLEFLETFLVFINDNKFNLIYGGDININMMKNDSPKLRLDTLLEMNACWNTISLPTRVTENSSSLIDVFITNLSSEVINAGVFASDLSDHLPIYLCFKGHVRNKETKTNHFIQLITDQALSIFREKIAQTCWDTVYDLKDANLAYEAFSAY